MKSSFTPLLHALNENSLVKAAAVVNHGGTIIEKVGSAKVFDLTGPPPTKKPNENVYLVELNTHDMLIAVFEEHIDFERLRSSVDTLIAHHGLEQPDA